MMGISYTCGRTGVRQSKDVAVGPREEGVWGTKSLVVFGLCVITHK
jgi:hypothetical protein